MARFFFIFPVRAGEQPFGEHKADAAAPAFPVRHYMVTALRLYFLLARFLFSAVLGWHRISLR